MRIRWFIALPLLLLFGLFGGPAWVYLSGDLELEQHWREADRSSIGVAPSAADHPDAIVQVYAARAYNWRGAFGIHAWIATKGQGEPHYRVYEVTRWDLSRLYATASQPDRTWYGNRPELLLDLRGEDAEAIVSQVADTAGHYPYESEYRVWPGPNSNTFVAWLIREVPGLDVESPPTAVGKDYLPGGWIAAAPSGTGYQVSLGGYAGLTLARAEGLELNLLGLTFGIDPGDRAIKLPGVGRIGLNGRSPTG